MWILDTTKRMALNGFRTHEEEAEEAEDDEEGAVEDACSGGSR